MESTQIIAIAVIGILVCFYIFIRVYKRGLRQTAIDLILEAEKCITSGNGKEKMSMVIGGIKSKFAMSGLPLSLLSLIPDSVIEKFVQDIFNQVKALLDYKGE